MDSVALYCTAALVARGIYWFICILGPVERKGKRASDLSGGSISAESVKDNYNQYWFLFFFFFFLITGLSSANQNRSKVPDFVTRSTTSSQTSTSGDGDSLSTSPLQSPENPSRKPRGSTKKWPLTSSKSNRDRRSSTLDVVSVGQ
ncbi:BnaCnng28360D [Brassica napus]|uniref:BnaCnng28360D protein n=1 Tax=Brassica napus TaxID=3708 RepID=A0A078IUT4_BRANA|nr:BnaCnng28360D [Brassica napus]